LEESNLLHYTQMKTCPVKHKSPQKLKILMWVFFISLLGFSVWIGTNSEFADAATTSATETVPVTATVNPVITINVPQASVTLTVTPGTPDTGGINIEVTTNDDDGYKLYEYQNHDLAHTSDSDEITPNWTANATHPTDSPLNGLGFALSGTTAGLVEGRWNSGGNYATFANTAANAEEANNYACYAATSTVINATYYLDVNTTQKSGVYENETYWYAVTNN